MDCSPSSTYCYTDRGSKGNEDFVYACEGFGLVLDGASGLGAQTDVPSGFQSTSQWYSHSIGTLLVDSLPGARGLDCLRQAVESAVRAVAERYLRLAAGDEQDGTVMPSCTLAVALVRPDALHLAWLGDSPLVLCGAGARVVVDPALGRVDATALAAMEERSRGKLLTGTQKRELIDDVLLANRKARNTSDAYWILDPTLAGLPHVHYQSVPREGVSAVYGMSDGMFAAVEKYGMVKAEQLNQTMGTYPQAVALVDRMRTIELADKDLDRYPRFKPSDDASVFRIALG